MRSAAQEYVVNVLETLRMHTAEESVMIDSVIELIHSKVGKWMSRQKDQKNSQIHSSKVVLPKLKTAVEDLTRTS